MSAWDRLAKDHASPNLELPLKRVGLAVLGNGLVGGHYKNLMHVGPSPAGLVLQLRAPWILRLFMTTKTVVIPWNLVRKTDKPAGFAFVPQEVWALGAEGISLTVPRGIIEPPR